MVSLKNNISMVIKFLQNLWYSPTQHKQNCQKCFKKHLNNLENTKAI